MPQQTWVELLAWPEELLQNRRALQTRRRNPSLRVWSSTNTCPSFWMCCWSMVSWFWGVQHSSMSCRAAALGARRHFIWAARRRILADPIDALPKALVIYSLRLSNAAVQIRRVDTATDKRTMSSQLILW